MLYGVLLLFLLIYMLATFALIYTLITGKLITQWSPLTAHVTYDEEETGVYDAELASMLTPLEKERIEEQKKFDARIEKIKQELNQVGRKSGVVAQESPGVRNLPDSAVVPSQPDEVAD